MAWRRTGDGPLPEAMLTQFTDAYMRHYGWVGVVGGGELNVDKPSNDEPPLPTVLVSNADVIIKASLGTAPQQSVSYCDVIDHVQRSLLLRHADRWFRCGFWGIFHECKSITVEDESTQRFIIPGLITVNCVAFVLLAAWCSHAVVSTTTNDIASLFHLAMQGFWHWSN